MKRVDWLVVGAGLVGSVLAERLASQQGKKVLVVERRGHLGGNVHDQLDAHGVWIHSYGPHLFHTNSDRVWNYLSQFTGWKTYEHRVLGWIDGQYVPIPFNFTAIERLFPSQKADLLKEQLRANYGEGARVPVLRLLEEDSPELQEFGQYVFDKVYAGYTTKQWGLLPDQLDASVLGRVPVVVGYDDRYFVDRYQALPQGGYTRMIERMLDQPGIEVMLNTDYESLEDVTWNRMIYTGPIDAFFGRRFGALPYRSLRFEWKHLDQPQFQPAAQVNYPNDHEYTRVAEYKWITGQEHPGTTLSYEYPVWYVPGENEPYYPVINQENKDLMALYLQEAKKMEGKVYFAGRLADYRYYNMDQAVGRALKLFEELPR